MPDIELKLLVGKCSRGRFSVSVHAGSEVVATGRVDPFRPEEIDAILEQVNKGIPGVNGEITDLRRELMNLVGPRAAARAGNLPCVVIGPDEYRVVDEVVKALATDDQIFKRGGLLVRVVRDDRQDNVVRPTGAPTIAIAPPPWVRERTTAKMHFASKDAHGQLKPAHPTSWMIAEIAARGQWPEIRELTAISDSPILRADGSVFQSPGYDKATGVLFETSATFPPMPQDVGLDAAAAAAARILETVADFRFEAPEHRAAWLACLLTPLARHAFAGPAPGFLFDANIRGAGKGLLVQVAAEIATGRPVPVAGYHHQSTEMSKIITSLVMAGDAMFLLDNVEGNFGNDAIDRLLTCARWKDRLLGTNMMVDLPFLSVFCVTGNNVQVAADTVRRLLHIRLDVLEERPEERSDFQHPALLRFIRANRPALFIDALTIVAAYYRAGRPDQHLTPYGSFEAWSSLVRSAIVWIGMPDPCETRAKLAEMADTSADLLEQLIQAWQGYDPHSTGIVIAEMVARLYAPDHPPTDPASIAMRAALETLAGTQPGKAPSVRTIGNRLSHFRGRVLNKVRLDIDRSRHTGRGAVWKLSTLKNEVSG